MSEQIEVIIETKDVKEISMLYQEIENIDDINIYEEVENEI